MIEPMGADTLVWTRLGATPLSLRVSGQTRVAPGARLPLAINAKNLSLFDAQTGLRL